MKRKRKLTEAEKEEKLLRYSLHMKLDRISHMQIRIQRQRAVIGELYNRVRLGECLLTYNMQDPQLITLDTLKHLLTSRKWTSVTSLWYRIQTEAERYRLKRRKVIHPWERGSRD